MADEPTARSLTPARSASCDFEGGGNGGGSEAVEGGNGGGARVGEGVVGRRIGSWMSLVKSSTAGGGGRRGGLDKASATLLDSPDPCSTFVVY